MPTVRLVLLGLLSNRFLQLSALQDLVVSLQGRVVVFSILRGRMATPSNLYFGLTSLQAKTGSTGIFCSITGMGLDGNTISRMFSMMDWPISFASSRLCCS